MFVAIYSHQQQNISFAWHPSAADVTDRKQALSALRKSEELYRKLVTTVPEGTVRTALDGTMRFVLLFPG